MTHGKGRRATTLLSAHVALVLLVWCRTAVAFSNVVPSHTSYSRGRHGGQGRWWQPFPRLSMSANDITPTNGLTTSTGGIQRGRRTGGETEEEHPEFDLFAPMPTVATSKINFAAVPGGSPHFGDIMGGSEGKGAGLLHHFEPLERVVLTANGNLQRVISSYYDSPVTVEIKRCEEVEPSVYDREVSLSVLGREFCVAKSLVVLHCPECVDAVKNGGVGIGQLFRSLDILPSFELLNAGRQNRSSWTSDRGRPGAGTSREGQPSSSREDMAEGGLWRVYDLRSRHVSCRIHEEFPPDLFNLKPL